MNTETLKEIIEIIERAEIDVLNIEKDGFNLYFQKNGAVRLADHTAPVKPNGEQQTDQEPSETVRAEKEVTTEENNQIHEITAPMIGTFYSRPRPDAEPFVQIGSIVAKNETVCVLEAMKLVNEVMSDIDGEIIDILAEDGQLIEYGQPLFKVKVVQ